MREYIFSIFKKLDFEIDSLNGLRALSLLLILIHHLHAPGLLPEEPALLHLFLENITSAVDLFFILSGFLISGGLLTQWNKQRDLSFKKYFLRRSLRIFPAYYFFVGVSILAGLAQLKGMPAGPYRDELLRSLGNWWTDAFYVSNFFDARLIPHGWTLAIEEQFYTFFPLFAYFILFRLSRGKRMAVLIGLYFLPLVFRILHTAFLPEQVMNRYNDIYEFSYTRADCILMGILVMELYVSWREYFDRMVRGAFAWGLALSALGLMIWAHTLDLHQHPYLYGTLRYNAVNIGWGIITVLALNPSTWTARIMGARIFTAPARLAYSMYLWHLVFGAQGAVLVLGPKFTKMSWLQFAAIIAVSYSILFFASWLLYLLVEKPFMLLKDHLSGASANLRRQKDPPDKIVTAAEQNATPTAVDRGLRFTAVIIDYYLLLPLLFIHGLNRALSEAAGAQWRPVLLGIALAWSLCLLWIQFHSLVKHGTSLGPRLMGLAVRDASGNRLSVVRYVLLRVMAGHLAMLGTLILIPVNFVLFLLPGARTLGERFSGGRVEYAPRS